MSKSNLTSNSKIPQSDLDYVEKYTRYNCDKIKKIYKKFIQKYPYGMVSREEFKDIFKNLNETDNQDTANKNDSNEDLMTDRLFQMCDIDSNGFIDFKEYIILFWSRANGNLEEKLKFIFDIFDSDKSGYIDFYELHKIVKILYKLKNSDSKEEFENCMKNGFYKAYINNNNNLLSPSYYISFDIMKKFDTSRNAKLSRDEFINGCRTHEQIANFLTPFD